VPASKFVATQKVIPTGTALKTLLEIATPATARATLFKWWVEFDGVTANTPALVELVRASAAITGTALTPVKYDDFAPASLMTVRHTATAEGTPTDILEAHYVPPTSGYQWSDPMGRDISVPISSFLRIRVTVPTTGVNACVGMCWEE
jgi:hypothetical protein